MKVTKSKIELKIPEKFFLEKIAELLDKQTIDSYRLRLNNPKTAINELFIVIRGYLTGKIHNDIYIKSLKEELLRLLAEEDELKFGRIKKNSIRSILNNMPNENIAASLKIITNDNTDYGINLNEKIQVLKEEFKLFSDYYNINNYGFWEHGNYVLIRKDADAKIIEKYSLTKSELKEKKSNWKSILIEERNKRSKPRLDDKTLTSWNALMLKGYIDAYRVFGNVEYLETAKKNASKPHTVK